LITVDGIIFSLQEHGGISIYFFELLKRGIRDSIDMAVLLFDEEAMHRAGEPPKVIKQNRRFLERYRSCLVPPNTQLFHSSYYRLPKSKGIPTITTVHDFTYERFISGVKRWVHSSQKFKAIRDASAVICVSENTRKDLFEFLPNVREDKVYIVPNGVGDAFFPLDSSSYLSSHRPYVLFVGSRAGYKNFNVAIEALGLLQDIELVCVGGGAFSKFECLQLEKNLTGRYSHKGAASDNHLNILYNNALCLLYPSSYEGFGIPILEAMRAGCPVVAVETSSIPEVAGDAALLLKAAEPALLANAIERVADNDIRQQLRQKGLRRSQAYSWDRTYFETVEVYKAVLGHALPRTSS